MLPRLSVVLLTWNEERNIGACLRALARQADDDFEVIVVDAASTDRTAEIVRAAQAGFPVLLRFVAAPTRIPIGEARNQGVALARAPLIAFASADAELDPSWTQEAIRSMLWVDMAFSRQVHAPHEWSAAATVRGLRYHFPRKSGGDALPYASNVAAVYRHEVLEAFPFDPAANAAEDLLLARRALSVGYRAAYNPRMLVHHHDVATARQEWRKNVREGAAMAVYRRELGLQKGLLAWGGILAACATAAVLRPRIGLPALAAAAMLPALRRTLFGRHTVPWRRRLKGLTASAPFDVAFLACYLGRLLLPAAPAPSVPLPAGAAQTLPSRGVGGGPAAVPPVSPREAAAHLAAFTGQGSPPAASSGSPLAPMPLPKSTQAGNAWHP